MIRMIVSERCYFFSLGNLLAFSFLFTRRISNILSKGGAVICRYPVGGDDIYILVADDLHLFPWNEGFYTRNT